MKQGNSSSQSLRQEQTQSAGSQQPWGEKHDKCSLATARRLMAGSLMLGGHEREA